MQNAVVFSSSLYESSLAGWVGIKNWQSNFKQRRIQVHIFFFKKYFICLKNFFQGMQNDVKNILFNFSCRFLNPNYFFQFEFKMI